MVFDILKKAFFFVIGNLYFAIFVPSTAVGYCTLNDIRFEQSCIYKYLLSMEIGLLREKNVCGRLVVQIMQYSHE